MSNSPRLKTLNPFACPVLGPGVQAVDVESRIDMVKKFTLYECEQALQLPDLQATVRRAIERRMKRCRAAVRKDQ